MNFIFGARFAAALRKERDADLEGFLNVLMVITCVVGTSATGIINLINYIKG